MRRARRSQQTLYAHTHGALRRLLGERCNCSPERLELSYDATGRFSLPHPPFFSLSYAGGRSWVALSLINPVGLDVVSIAAGGVVLDGALVSAADVAALHAAGVASRTDLVAWAVKEAAAKLTGDVGLDPASWTILHEGSVRVQAPAHAAIAIELRMLEGGLTAAIARSF